MLNRKKSSKFVALTLLASILVVAAFMMSVNAQSTSTVTVLSGLGGTTDPAAGATNTYNSGDTVTLTATAVDGYAFQEWQIASESGAIAVADNPYTLTVVGGQNYAIQPVFAVIQQVPGIPPAPFKQGTDAVIGILASAGGTTNPPAGLYYLTDATAFNLKATAASGWTFSHWVISGPGLSHGGYPYTATPTDNPYNVNHGYGNRFDYQAVFTPTGTTEPTPTVPEFSSVAVIVVALAFVAIAVGTYTYRRKTK